MGNYEAEFKGKIIRLHLEEGRTIRSLADEYDISKASISNWVRNYREKCQRRIRLYDGELQAAQTT